jgi:hypothetical protein
VPPGLTAAGLWLGRFNQLVVFRGTPAVKDRPKPMMHLGTFLTPFARAGPVTPLEHEVEQA